MGVLELIGAENKLDGIIDSKVLIRAQQSSHGFVQDPIRFIHWDKRSLGMFTGLTLGLIAVHKGFLGLTRTHRVLLEHKSAYMGSFKIQLGSFPSKDTHKCLLELTLAHKGFIGLTIRSY